MQQAEDKMERGTSNHKSSLVGGIFVKIALKPASQNSLVSCLGINLDLT